MDALVVARDGHIDVAQRRVGVAQRNHRDVHVRGLGDGLVVGAWVADDQQARLAEGLASALVSEGTRSESASDGSSLGGRSELEHRTLAKRTAGDDEDVSRVLNGHDGTRSEQDLLPGLADVDDVHT